MHDVIAGHITCARMQRAQVAFFMTESKSQMKVWMPMLKNCVLYFTVLARTMLANQFAVGLRQDIKVKVVGVEGTFEQLLTKAKFEEAKLRDIGTSSSIVLPTKRQPSLPRNDRTVQGFNTINQKRCCNCNTTGHFSRNCPVRRHAVPTESHGRSNHNKSSRDTGSKKVATIVSENSKAQNEGKERISELCEALKQSMNL